jgi:hypothetical protein
LNFLLTILLQRLIHLPNSQTLSILLQFTTILTKYSFNYLQLSIFIFFYSIIFNSFRFFYKSVRIEFIKYIFLNSLNILFIFERSLSNLYYLNLKIKNPRRKKEKETCTAQRQVRSYTNSYRPTRMSLLLYLYIIDFESHSYKLFMSFISLLFSSLEFVDEKRIKTKFCVVKEKWIVEDVKLHKSHFSF